MAGYGYGISVSGSRTPVVAGGATTPTIYKVAIFGAGSLDADGEYIYDGENNGKPKYARQDSNGNPWNIFFNGYDWALDFDGGEAYYYGTTQINWSEGEIGDPPYPSAVASYSQSSYIQTVVLAGGNPDQSGTYTWDGTTFVNGKPKYFGPLKSGAPENNYIYWNTENYMLYGFKIDEMVGLSVSADLASNWSPSEANQEPTVSNIIYTA